MVSRPMDSLTYTVLWTGASYQSLVLWILRANIVQGFYGIQHASSG